MPIYRTIRIAWFNRQTKENGSGDWVPNIHLKYLKQRVIKLNQSHPIIMHWLEERSSSGEAVNLGSNFPHSSSMGTPAPPPYPPPAPPAFPPPYPPHNHHPHNNLSQHLYGDP